MTILIVTLIVAVAYIFFQSVRIVPQQQAWVVQRLGKYQTTLDAGLHFLVPFIDAVAYKHTLKE
ncbi:MAG: SPFH domain-containing protein, partial [Kiritimatiellaeota bacterium]|nr:SPFH domain-containing protein [Kiritimatiellota bacterium]